MIDRATLSGQARMGVWFLAAAGLMLLAGACWEREAEERVTITGAIAGYEATLPRKQAEELRDFLNANVSEERIAVFLARLMASEARWEVKVLAALIAVDVVLFKKKMNDNMGPAGVVVRVWGLDASGLEVCTLIRRAPYVPEEWKAKATVAATVPVFWRITPRTKGS